jgi:hypothetical protein
LTLKKKYASKEEEGNFSISISREDLANIAGTATESLIRTLSDFKSEKSWVRRRTIGSVTYEENINLITLNSDICLKIKKQDTLEWIALKNIKKAAITGPHLRWIEEWINLSDRPARGKVL